MRLSVRDFLFFFKHTRLVQTIEIPPCTFLIENIKRVLGISKGFHNALIIFPIRAIFVKRSNTRTNISFKGRKIRTMRYRYDYRYISKGDRTMGKKGGRRSHGRHCWRRRKGMAGGGSGKRRYRKG